MLKKMKDYGKNMETSKKTDGYNRNAVFCIKQESCGKNNIYNSIKIN
jgi:hypothetical protein